MVVAFFFVDSRLFEASSTALHRENRSFEDLITIADGVDVKLYRKKRRIPMMHFLELYLSGRANIKTDMPSLFASRYEWASFALTISDILHILFRMAPTLWFHNRLNDQQHIAEAYDQDEDIYNAFLGETRMYSSGLVSSIDTPETLEQLQHNNMHNICRKLQVQVDDLLLDIGCGYGTFARFASTNYGARTKGVTLSRRQATIGRAFVAASSNLTESRCQIQELDYRDIPLATKYKRVVCIEMAEHVGVRNITGLFAQIYRLLEPDGTFFLQIGSFRTKWQYEDLVWGMFMNRYIFPGSDTSASIADYTYMLENAGFEIKSVDNIGAHCSSTIWRWYQNWQSKEKEITAKHGQRTFRMVLFYLSSCMVLPQEGIATTFQIVAMKATPQTDRLRGIVKVGR